MSELPEDTTVVSTNLQAAMDQAVRRPPAPKPVMKPEVDEATAALDAVLDAPNFETASVEAVVKEAVGHAEPHVSDEKALPVAKTAAETKALEVSISEGSVLQGAGTMALFEAMKVALDNNAPAVFKVVALQSGYTAEMSALAFEDISRIQASSIDAHAARIKLLKTLHARVQEFSCGHVKFPDWLKITAQGDYETLMYGMYAATYPGENDFDVKCRHCGHDNKVTVDVGVIARVESDEVYGEIRKLLDPKTDFKGAISNSMVGHTVQRKLPRSGIIAELRNPSIQDYLDGVQWFAQAQDRNTGALPVDLAGAEVTRTLTMYVPRLLVPVPNTNNYLAVTDQAQRASIIGRLGQVDGEAITAAVDDETKRLEVSYSLPHYNCAACAKKNDELFLDFEALLFIRLREKV